MGKVTVLHDGKRFSMDEADKIVLTLFDSKTKTMLTFTADTAHGFGLAHVKAHEHGATEWQITFVPSQMSIVEGIV